jgi:hypothetical protein
MMRRQFLVGLLLAGVAGVAGAADKPATAASPVAERGTNVQVTAYYFHGTMRCETCRKIEKQAREAIERRFAVEVAEKRLVFKPVNYDEPENAHFLKDYKLAGPSLVLVREVGGKEQDWKLLGQTWESVHIPPKLDLYVEEETARFLEGNKFPAGQGLPNSNSVANSQRPGTRGGRVLGSLSELNTLTSEMNAVFVFLPAKDRAPTAAALAAIDGAKKGLEARFEIKIGLFTLMPGSPDYSEIAAQMAVPGVVAIVKTGVRRFISGELTEDKIVEGFMAAMGAGGCCPLGYPRERR